jgi:hypothetical protein
MANSAMAVLLLSLAHRQGRHTGSFPARSKAVTHGPLVGHMVGQADSDSQKNQSIKAFSWI